MLNLTSLRVGAFPPSRISPLIVPEVFRPARMSSSVDFPEPEGPIKAVSLMYREGVSEHQLQHILSTEVIKLKEAIDKDFPNIKIIFVTLN